MIIIVHYRVSKVEVALMENSPHLLGVRILALKMVIYHKKKIRKYFVFLHLLDKIILLMMKVYVMHISFYNVLILHSSKSSHTIKENAYI